MPALHHIVGFDLAGDAVPYINIAASRVAGRLG